MRVVMLYNEVSEDPAYDPWLEEDPIFPVVDAMMALGHGVRRLSCTLDLAAVKTQLSELQPDIVFNRVESLGGSDQMMAAMTMLMDVMRIPFTGCGTGALLATTSKLATKRRFLDAGLPTPAWCWIGGEEQLEFAGINDAANDRSHCRGLWIIKSIYEHASFKIDDDAVADCNDSETLKTRIIDRMNAWQRPFFAEQYIAGREFNISVLATRQGPIVLPHAEIDFSAFPDDKPKIVGYAAKWQADTFEYKQTPRTFDFSEKDAALLEEIRELTLQCWHVFQLTGYARVDFRVDDSGRPWILEINANPSLAPDSGFAAAVERAGMTYEQAIQSILDDAIHRSTTAV